ncbi:phage baseplate assembly protein V [Vibrio plantisponsor]|uniref:Phage baseplate assembly protein V n=1 Tax=Vibrio plantisponsor TaxID=664643 RepID=A0ABU4IIJ2_9VIBR|nr:phage baseplate assembly protein V [Vibrio plantisponsor]MDW6017642.1 phage baseplate assembly protein V [Vibrio plantisponsor]
MHEFTQSQLVRRISQMIQIGTIVEVQAKPLRYKVQFTTDLTTSWIPSDVGHAGAVKDFAPHQAGELVLVVKEFNTQGGVIVASLNQNSKDQPKDDLNLFYREFPDGTWLQYDMGSKVLSGSVVGKVNLDAATEIRLAAPKLIFDGDIEHDGKQTSTGDISSSAGSISAAMNVSAGQNISDSVRSMAEDRDIYNNHDHQHGDPVTGKANQKQ